MVEFVTSIGARVSPLRGCTPRRWRAPSRRSPRERRPGVPLRSTPGYDRSPLRGYSRQPAL